MTNLNIFLECKQLMNTMTIHTIGRNLHIADSTTVNALCNALSKMLNMESKLNYVSSKYQMSSTKCQMSTTNYQI